MGLPEGITTVPRSEYYQGLYEDDTRDYVGDLYYYQGRYLFECVPTTNHFVISLRSRNQPTVDQTLRYVDAYLKERPSWYIIATVFELTVSPKRLIEHPFIYWAFNFSREKFISDVSTHWDYRRAEVSFLGYGSLRLGEFWFNMSRDNWSPVKGVTIYANDLPREFIVDYLRADIDFVDPEILRRILVTLTPD